MANGILIIDKPAGWTSHDVVAKLRGILHEKRIGHAGTLDPMATGVLPVFVGRATRAVEFAAEREKEYLAGLRLGLTTDTQDTTGTVTATHPVTAGRADLEAVLPQFTGDILQIPPMYSAIKRQGQKLYELARRGQEVERDPRPVTIHALEILDQPSPTEYTLRVACSKGTYVRTLCHDIGQALGCGGTMYALRRTQAAGFTLDQAVTLEAVQAAAAGGGLLCPPPRPDPSQCPGREKGPQRQPPLPAWGGWSLPGLQSGGCLPGPEPPGPGQAHHYQKLFRGVRSWNRKNE